MYRAHTAAAATFSFASRTKSLLTVVEMLDGSRIFSDVFLWFKKAEYVVLCALMFKSDLVIKEGGTVITVY